MSRRPRVTLVPGVALFLELALLPELTQLANGTFKVTTPNGQLWEQCKLWEQGQLWPQDYPWNQGYAWTLGQLWPQGALWSQASNYSADINWVDGYPSPIGSSVGTASAMSINSWVAPEYRILPSS